MTRSSSAVRVVAVLFLSVLTVPAKVIEWKRHITVEVNQTQPVSFTCQKSRPTSSIQQEWKHNSKKISYCNKSTKVPAKGEVCVRLFPKSQLKLLFGPIQHTSGGVYTCIEYGITPRDIVGSTNVSVTVMEPKSPSVRSTVDNLPIAMTSQPNRNSSSAEVTPRHGAMSSFLTMTTVQSTTQLSTNTVEITSVEFLQESLRAEDDSLNINTLIAIVTVMSGSLAVLAAVFFVVWIRNGRGRLVLGGVKKLIPRYKQWEFSRNQLKFERELGIGFFGVVYGAQAYAITSPGVWSTVAVKLAKDSEDYNLHTAGHASLCDEAKLLTDMGKCEHKNVVRLLGICSLEGPLWLIVEYASKGSLRSYLRSLRISECDEPSSLTPEIQSKENNEMTERKIYQFALDCASGMEYLVGRKILHCDLAARNVLVFEDETLKISDFGMAKDVRYVEYFRRKQPGILPVKWMSPEAMMDKLHTQASDVWSFGILAWEIATLGGTPYPGIAMERLYDLLANKQYRMSSPVNCPRRLYDIMQCCWADVPSNRPTFAKLVGQIEGILKELDDLSDEESGNDVLCSADTERDDVNMAGFV